MAAACTIEGTWEVLATATGEPRVVFPAPAMATKRAQGFIRSWRRSLKLVGLLLLLGAADLASQSVIGGNPVKAYVALMAGQKARPLDGQFNRVPVLHSNQPEEVEGPGILINTAPGTAYSPESGQTLRNAEYTFDGDFGIHLHHKYFPPYRNSINPGGRRSELTIGVILINSGYRPVHIKFSTGAVRNSFEAPYLANSMTGVRPLGPRPWNTGPGDATAIQMLRGRLDPRLADEITIPARSRIVLFQTDLPALGIANALLRGRSDGPFQIAVVAAKEPQSEWDLVNVLDQGRLAPGRVYLSRIAEINNRQIFSRVGGVAIGDTYTANLSHNLELSGPLHVPLTSTFRHNFGTREIQVNPLVARMIDSSLDNVGTYGVRFDLDFNLQGSGTYDLVLSHPSAGAGRPFTAFRGSIQVKTEAGVQEYHVVLKSGQSLAVSSLDLKPGDNPVKVSLVYPADATPGHLLSIVPAQQLSRVQEQERQLMLAKAEAERAAKRRHQVPSRQSRSSTNERPAALPDLPPLPAEEPQTVLGIQEPIVFPPPVVPSVTMPPASFPPELVTGPEVAPAPATSSTPSMIDRYQQALEAQQQIMRDLYKR